MKKSILGLWCALMVAYQVYSQPYAFSYHTGTYSHLSGSNSCNNGLTWDDPNFTIPIGFSFNYFGVPIDTIKISLGFGGTLLTTLNSNGIASFLAPFGSDLMDRGYNFSIGPGRPGSLSNISYQTIGTAGNRIFKLEWNNAGFYGDIQQNGTNATDFVNFQLWLYETSDEIEIHFGPNSVTNPIQSYGSSTGPDIVLVPSLNLNNTSFGANYYCLSGIPISAIMQTRTPNQNPVYLNGTIPDGTIYRFSPSITLLSESTSMNRNKIFPQPAQDHLMLSGIEPFDIGRGFKILDFKGRVGKVGSLRNNRIDISELSNGIYFLQLEGRLGSKTYKFIIQR